MINPKSLSISEVLAAYKPMEIPNFQRDYKWGKSEAIEFIEDLNYYSKKPDESLYLGTIILSKNTNGSFSIIDGQQRLTTINILLAVCRNQAHKINNQLLKSNIQLNLTYVNQTTGETLGPFISVSNSIKEPFEELVSEQWKGSFTEKKDGKSYKKKINKIRPIFDYFTEELKDFDQKALSAFLSGIYKSYVVCIQINDPFEAFSIFERTNGRGIDLEASDLLKNYFFSKQVEGIEEIWTEIVENSDTTLLRMLKYFYVSKDGYVLKSNLYTKIKSLGSKIGDETLLREILNFSRFYKAIKKSSESQFKEYLDSIGFEKLTSIEKDFKQVFNAVEGLREFKITQFYPLVYAAILAFKKQHGSSFTASKQKILVKVFDALEKYHFANNAVCDRIGNEVEKPYADYCVEFSKTDDFDSVAETLVNLLRSKLVRKDEFVSRFTDIKYESGSIGLIAYIYDRLTNYNRSPGIKFYSSDSYQNKLNTIEHFYPQNPTEDIPKISLIDSIGNLLVISNAANIKLSNKTPSEKALLLSNELVNELDSNPLLKEFHQGYVRTPKWADEEISNRAINLANAYYEDVIKNGELV